MEMLDNPGKMVAATAGGGNSASIGDTALTPKSLALQRWYYGIGNAANAPCDAVFLGDSLTAGYEVLTSQRWQTLIAPLLRAKFQPSGVTGGRGYFPVMPALGDYPSDWPVTFTGSTAHSNIDGMGAESANMSAAGDTITLTTGSCTSIDIFYYQNNLTGPWSYKLNGGGTVNVTGTGADTIPFNKQHVTGTSTSGTNTLVITNGSGAAFIDGFMIYNGDETKGLRFWDSGQSGAQVQAFLDSNGFLNDLAVVQPSLVTITSGGNEWGGNDSVVNAATYKANLQTLIQGIYNNTTVKPSIVLMIGWNINPLPGAQPLSPLAEFVNAQYAIAAADSNVCVCDMRARINSGAASYAGGLLIDEVHPSAQGSVLFAQALATFLTP